MKYKIKLYSRVKIDTQREAKAYANVLCLDDRCKSFVEGFVETSQSRVSLLGIVKGLEQIKESAEVTIITTNKYAVTSFAKGWIAKWKANNWLKKDGEPPLNVDLWKRFADQMERHEISFDIVKHYKHYPQLIEARNLGQEVLEKGPLQIDEVYRRYIEELNYTIQASEELISQEEIIEVEDEKGVVNEVENLVYHYKEEETEQSLDDLEEELEEDLPEEEDQRHIRPQTYKKMPPDLKFLLLIRDQLNRYFADDPTLLELRSTDLYTEVCKNKRLKERFPYPMMFNHFLRRQHQEGVLKQIIPNCKIDTYKSNSYQWYFHR